MKKNFISLFLICVLTLAGFGTALAGNPNPGVIPNEGDVYGRLAAKWWRWAYSFPAADVPFFNTGGAVNIVAGQSDDVWFLAGSSSSNAVERTGTIPAEISLFFPLVNLVNDFPCPDPTFVPTPGQTLENFLQEGAKFFLDNWFAAEPSQLFAEIDSVPVNDLITYRATSAMFKFKADPALVSYDPCITGKPQYGVADGYWLLLPPLAPGVHNLHFGLKPALNPSLDPYKNNFPQDITYVLTVTSDQ